VAGSAGVTEGSGGVAGGAGAAGAAGAAGVVVAEESDSESEPPKRRFSQLVMRRCYKVPRRK